MCPIHRPNLPDPGRIIAHRGASQVAPENTLKAFRTADRQGAYWLEFDVSLLGDGTAVIHHDDTLDRCTNATGPLSGITAADLSDIEAGEGEPLPTLSAALDLIKEFGFFANLEMKPHALEPGILSGVVAKELRLRPWASERIIVSSFKQAELTAFRAACPDQPIAVLWQQPEPDWPLVLDRLNAAAIHVAVPHLSQTILRQAKVRGVDVRVYTANDPKLMAPFRDLGLTSIITDHPPLYLEDEIWATWAKS